MTVCQRSECNTTAGCAHRGPLGEFCYFPAAAEVGPKDAIEWQAWSMKVEAATIERCAQVARSFGERWASYKHEADEIANAIEALKDK